MKQTVSDYNSCRFQVEGQSDRRDLWVKYLFSLFQEGFPFPTGEGSFSGIDFFFWPGYPLLGREGEHRSWIWIWIWTCSKLMIHIQIQNPSLTRVWMSTPAIHTPRSMDAWLNLFSIFLWSLSVSFLLLLLKLCWTYSTYVHQTVIGFKNMKIWTKSGKSR